MAGCTAHGRRPFWRYREEDIGFCYYMLTGFVKLAGLEKRIDFEGRTLERVLKIRGRYGRMIWIAMQQFPVKIVPTRIGPRAVQRDFYFRKG